MAAPEAAPRAREGAGRRRKRILVAALALLAAMVGLEAALRFTFAHADEASRSALRSS